jgi:fructan beta-fructosidase
LPGQQEVSGFEGKRLVNSFNGSDGTTGTLTSPPFTIERDYIRFLIGGGGHEGKTCINLVVDGDTVATATGPNTEPGGSEELEPSFWEVGKYKGKSAVIRIVDRATGGWGHINVDHIVQRPHDGVDPAELVRRSPLERPYLNLPVKNGARSGGWKCSSTAMPCERSTSNSRHASPTGGPIIDISPFGEARKRCSKSMTADAADSRWAEDRSIRPTRSKAPRICTTRRSGRSSTSARSGAGINDPNGMVYYDGEYHLFFQHNPYGTRLGRTCTGATRSARISCTGKQLPIALFPWTQAVAHCFSGSAVVDAQNTAGFQAGDEQVIVAALTDTGCGEALAYSNDRGRTFTYYEGNPVVKHKGRDPKIIWYEPGKHWVMAVYTEQENSRAIAFYTSSNLKDWEYQSRLDGYYECPEIFELPVDGDPANTRWVVFAADAKYAVGRFDGKAFTPEHEGKHQVHWGAYYASQTFSGTPDGRRIQIGWGRIDMEGMPFNQMMTFPCRLTLHSTAEGIRMRAAPVKEIELLHHRKHALNPMQVEPGASVSVATSGRLFDIRAEFEVGQAKAFGLQIGDTKVIYDAAKADLMGMPLKPEAGKIRLQILVDRPSLEICGNDGCVYQTRAFRSDSEIDTIQVFAHEAPVQVNSLEVYELNSIWSK